MHLYGAFEHSLDGRGRVAIPAVFRRVLHEGGVLRPGQDGCLELYSREAFADETARRLGDSGTRRIGDRRLRRSFLPEAQSVDLDAQGRIVIPPDMRERAGLDGRVSLLGLGDYVEIWDPRRWGEEQRRAADEAAAAEAEA